MKLKVFSSDRAKSKLFEKALSDVNCKYYSSLNFGNVQSKYPISLNNPVGINNCLDRLLRKEIIQKIAPVAQSFSRDSSFNESIIIKKRRKNSNTSLDEDSFLVESKKEHSVFHNIYGGETYSECRFISTSEYILFASSDDVIFSYKIKRKEKYTGDVITNMKQYTPIFDFMKPKLWKKIESVSKSIIKEVGLDLGYVKIGYSSVGDRHSYIVFSASPELPFVEESIPFLKNHLTNILPSLEEKYTKLYETIKNKEEFGKIVFTLKKSPFSIGDLGALYHSFVSSDDSDTNEIEQDSDDWDEEETEELHIEFDNDIL